ncbi:MAG: ABC transporter permease [Chitinophagaceae bacterium]|jgi:putative ABC transport system permease protein|nr:ABC transporter permease [Chitinophagaceae bacterium]
MLTHLFRLIWNKKKQNFLLILEIFIAFIGLCAGFTFILYPYNNYKLPLGFEPQNVWVVNFDRPDEIKNLDSLQIFNESIKSVLFSLNGVEDVTYSSINFPLSGNGFNTAVRINGQESWAYFYSAEDNYIKVLGMKMQEGRWFSSDDKVANVRPAVINQTLKKKLFGSGDALGKIVEADAVGDKMKIVGVVADTKDESEMEVPGPGIFMRRDTIDLRHDYSILVKVKPGADPALESRMYKTLSNSMKNAEIEIEHLTDMKDAANKKMQVPFIIFIIIAGFLIINVGLGIFGVLWYNINKRKGEIGLRRAVGATGNAISKQLVGEALVLCTLSLILGLFFAVQFPLLSALQLPPENYVQAIILSVVFIYVLVLLCALYPGKEAARIYPAIALHED